MNKSIPRERFLSCTKNVENKSDLVQEKKKGRWHRNASRLKEEQELAFVVK
jgi:hypothetical protein